MMKNVLAKIHRMRRWIPLLIVSCLVAKSYLWGDVYYKRTKTYQIMWGVVDGAYRHYWDDSPDPIGVPWSTHFTPRDVFGFGGPQQELFGMNMILSTLRSGGFIWMNAGPRGGFRLLGFAIENGYTGSFGSSGAIKYKRVVIPFWPLGLAASIHPWIVWRKRKHRIALISSGKCGQCGYDLRATSERCPECGTIQERLKV